MKRYEDYQKISKAEEALVSKNSKVEDESKS